MKRIAYFAVAALFVFSAAVFVWANFDPRSPEIPPTHPLDPSDLFIVSDPVQLGSQPILLLINLQDSNVFAKYAGEILKTEGFFSYETVDLSRIDCSALPLQSYSAIITATDSKKLGDNEPLFREYVKNGGSLLMFSPPSSFDELLGVSSGAGVLENGYVLIDTTTTFGNGRSPHALQFFGTSHLLKSGSSTSIAELLDDNRQHTGTSAIGFRRFEKGLAAYFAYDLGRSIVYTRQGIPAQTIPSNADGDGVFKTTDLFYNTFDYYNRDIPQGDEQQKLFGAILEFLIKDHPPVPRAWYFPNGLPSIALVTGDSHGKHCTPSIHRLADYVRSRNGHYTVFKYPEAVDSILFLDLERYGHTLAPHFYYQRPENRLMRLKQKFRTFFSPTSFFRPTLSELEGEIAEGNQTFLERTGQFVPINRFHYLCWYGWSEPAELLASKKFRLDLSITGMNPKFPYWNSLSDPSNSPGGYGYINGSGLPMRYADKSGTPLPIFSQLTQFEDDVTVREALEGNSTDSAVVRRLKEITRGFIDASTLKYHSVLVWNFHPEHIVLRWPSNAPTTWEWFTSTVDYLREKQIPMLSAEEWLHFWEARSKIRIDKATYDSVRRIGGFDVDIPEAVDGLTFRLPKPNGITNVRSMSVEAIDLVSGGDPKLRYLLKNDREAKYFEIQITTSNPVKARVVYSLL